GNRRYEHRFGRVFLIRAAGRSRAEILAELERRLLLDDQTELAIVGGQLLEIALLRLEQTFGSTLGAESA
ncbi:MAG: OHCU decarboxylase, partial [Microbacteriaceae bacterium]|nr:OHCU decarboxylase [Microbacteriaceae bacterium]